jgi:hypothetical protein
VGIASGRRPGGGDRTDEAGQRRARTQAAGLARRANRPGPLRQDLQAEHAVRDGERPRHNVCRLQRDTAAARDDAREHGRPRRRDARRADALHTGAHRRVLLRSLGRRAASSERDR